MGIITLFRMLIRELIPTIKSIDLSQNISLKDINKAW